MLSVILALWSPDFPHGRPFGLPTRLSSLLAELFYSNLAEKSMETEEPPPAEPGAALI